MRAPVEIAPTDAELITALRAENAALLRNIGLAEQRARRAESDAANNCPSAKVCMAQAAEIERLEKALAGAAVRAALSRASDRP